MVENPALLWSAGGFHTTAAIVFIFGSLCAHLYCMGSSCSCLPIHHFIIAVPVELALTFLPSWILPPPPPCFHSCSTFPEFFLLIPSSNCLCFVSLVLEAILVPACFPPHHIVKLSPGFNILMFYRVLQVVFIFTEDESLARWLKTSWTDLEVGLFFSGFHQRCLFVSNTVLFQRAAIIHHGGSN